jgi:hypothetical protein
MATYKPALQLFLDNTKTIKESFRWNNVLGIFLASTLLVSSDKKADSESLFAARDLLKKHAGVFSNLRGNSSLPLYTLFSINENPEAAVQNTIQVQELLKAEKFWRNDYLAFAAAQIALYTPPDQYAAVISRTREFYEAMKKKHPIITSADDYIFAVLLAMSDVDVQMADEKIEEYMELLKPHFPGIPNNRQMLAQILVLCTSQTDSVWTCEQVIDRIAALREILKVKKINPSYEISSILGVLAVLPGEVKDIADQVEGCYHDIKNEAGVKWQGKQIKLLVSASLVTLGAISEMVKTSSSAALANIIINLIIAQQIMLIMIIFASTTAASSANS